MASPKRITDGYLDVCGSENLSADRASFRKPVTGDVFEAVGSRRTRPQLEQARSCFPTNSPFGTGQLSAKKHCD
jgi:hypothetical protein